MMKTQRRLIAAALGVFGAAAAGAALAQSDATFGDRAYRIDDATVIAVPAPAAPDVVVVSPRVYVDGVPQDAYDAATVRRFDLDRHPHVVRYGRVDLTGPYATPAEVSQMTGHVDSSTAGYPVSGSGVQPGNMGPANSKGQ